MAKVIKINAIGETITFTKTTEETNGKFLEGFVSLPASGKGPPLHRHVFQTEYFETLEGKVGLDCNNEKVSLEPGQSYTVPENALHRCYALENEPAKLKFIFTPALNIEYILTEIFESCNRRNSPEPSIFDFCYVLQQAKGEYYLGDVPVWIQKTLIPLTARIGQIFGLIKANPKRG